MGLRDRLVKGPNAPSQADQVDRMAHDHNVEGDYETSRHTSSGHVLLRKSPWVERAEHNNLPAKELKP